MTLQFTGTRRLWFLATSSFVLNIAGPSCLSAKHAAGKCQWTFMTWTMLISSRVWGTLSVKNIVALNFVNLQYAQSWVTSLSRCYWEEGIMTKYDGGIMTKNVPQIPPPPPPPPQEKYIPDSLQHWSLNPDNQQAEQSKLSMLIKIRFFKVESASHEQILVTRRKINSTAFYGG